MFFNVLLLGSMRNIIIRPVCSTYPMRITLCYQAAVGTWGIQGDYYFSLRIVLDHIRFRSTASLSVREIYDYLYIFFARIRNNRS